MHVTHGPDIIRCGLQFIIHHHCAPLIQLYSRSFRVQPLRIGFSSCCDQHRICFQDFLFTFIGELHQRMAVCLGDLPNPGSQLEGYAAAFQHALYGFRHVPVLSRDQHFPILQNRHFCAEAGIHGGEFQTDITAAHDHKTFRIFSQIHQCGTGMYIGIPLQTLDRRNHRGSSCVDKDFLPFDFKGLKSCLHLHNRIGDKGCGPVKYIHIVQVIQFPEILFPEHSGEPSLFINGCLIIRSPLLRGSLFFIKCQSGASDQGF